MTLSYFFCIIKITSEKGGENMASVFNVASYFLSRSEPQSELAITHLKLQKLVYYAQAWTMAIRGEPLFPERIEAWIHGPVCPDLYYEFRHYGFDEIKPVSDFIPDAFSKQEIEILDAVWNAYGQYDGRYLEEMTHKEEPWKNARRGLRQFDQSNRIISLESMAKYYSSFS